MCKTVPSLDVHHFAWAHDNGLPILICVNSNLLRACFLADADLARLGRRSKTDDPLVFLADPSTEYALALSLCHPPTLQTLYEVVERSIRGLFCGEEVKEWVRVRLRVWKEDLGW